MKDKVAIITGSTAGIGLAIAKSLAKYGASVVINGRTLDKLKLAEREIEEIGGKVLAVQADASDEESVRRIVKETLEYFGKIDILVNNAATTGVGVTAAEMSIETWDEVLDVNLRGVFLFCKSVIPYLKDGSRIVNIGGLSSKNPLPFGIADACSKAGILALTRCLAAELGTKNITVNAVIPGLQPETETGHEFISQLAKVYHTDEQTVINGTIQKTLLKRTETVEEVAETVAFLCSENASAITGQNINVNCGLATY